MPKERFIDSRSNLQNDGVPKLRRGSHSHNVTFQRFNVLAISQRGWAFPCQLRRFASHQPRRHNEAERWGRISGACCPNSAFAPETLNT